MIFDRRPFYWIAAAAGVVLMAILWFALPRVGPERRVHEQLALLSREPWTEVLIERVETRTGNPSTHVVLHGVRLDTSRPVQIQFIGDSPYTAESAMRYLSDHALDGATADVLMLPRSITWEPYRSKFAPSTTHVGVALYAGLAESAAAEAIAPAAASGDMSVETPVLPAAVPPAETPPAPSPPPHG